MSTPMKIAVAGATGRVGRHLVDVLAERGHDVVPISRSQGVDVVTGDGLEQALSGVDCVIDATSGGSPTGEQSIATENFTAGARNLHALGEKTGVQRIVVVSIVGIDQFTAGYGAAKIAHEQAMQAGPIPVSILRASQFHEFVEQLVGWGRQRDVSYVTKMRIQPVAARSVAEKLVDLAVDNSPSAPAVSEIAGPREESLVELAQLFVARRGEPLRIEGISNPDDPDGALYESGALLPGPEATLAGPTFKEWLDSTP